MSHFADANGPAERAFKLGDGMAPLIYESDHIGWDVHGLDVGEQGPFYALLNPPCSVGTEAISVVWVEIVDGFYEAEVSLLNEVAEAHAPVGVFLCDIDDETEVASDELLSCPRVVLFEDEFSKLVLLLFGQKGSFVDFLKILFYGAVEDYGLTPHCQQIFIFSG